MPRPGVDLALLLLAAFRDLADAATDELATRGYPDHRPVHDFALRAVVAGADNASDLGRRLSVSKQAASKTIAVLERRGYLVREPDPADARRKTLRLTRRGERLLREGEEVFAVLRERWVQQVGAESVVAVEQALSTLVGPAPAGYDAPGWLASTTGDDG